MPILSGFVSGFKKKSDLFSRTTIMQKCQKLHYKNGDVIASTCFFAIAKPKKDIVLKFGTCVVCMRASNVYSDFLDNLKILDFIGICLKN